MQIQHKSDGREGKFFITGEDGAETALMTYVHRDDNKIIIDHTEVDPVHKGKGIGAQLVKAAIVMARAEGLKIIPACPFAKSIFDKMPEYRDVLA